MVHKMHACTAEGIEQVIETYKTRHGWPHDKLPLNVEFNARKGTTKHETCPYCGAASSTFEDVPPEDAQLLNVDPMASGYRNRPQSNIKAENAGLLAELRAIRKEQEETKRQLAKLQKDGGKA